MNEIIAVAIAATTGVAGYLYKIWADKVRSRKLVLFYMLEIHYVLKVLPVSTDGLVGRYLEYCKGLLKNAGLPIDENYDEMIEKIAPHIHVYGKDIDFWKTSTKVSQIMLSFCISSQSGEIYRSAE